MSSENTVSSFAELNLPAPLQKALNDVGYETPSAIQAETIPHLLRGVDLLGQAQTGTGKTAAFALPVLAKLDLAEKKSPQVMVLAPTRELAIQVAEAFQKYAHHMPGFKVLPVYGGSDMRGQLRQLERGVHVVVGTPGRIMDHMRRGSLKLNGLKTLILDEADEMLRMGFIDDVEWILEQTPKTRQIVLFSATMPTAIRRIAVKYLSDPQEITVKVKTVTNASIRQRVWMMAGGSKIDALTRILEVEEFDAMIVFVRTRIATVEVADKLAARGYASAAINGDIPQKQREMTIENLKNGKLDILVATDVAARGLDVTRISHVINYDIPYDVEAYIHRIGRTGRAGREGDAILFAANRERRLLSAIERATGQTIARMELPTPAEVTNKRIDKFKQRITETLSTTDISRFRKLVEEYQHEYGVPVIDIAAALVSLAQGKQSLLAQKGKVDRAPKESFKSDKPRERRPKEKRSDNAERAPRAGQDKPAPKARSEKPAPTADLDEAAPRVQQDFLAPKVKKERPAQAASGTESSLPGKDMERYRIEVGHKHEVKPGNIVGAIANEADLDSEYIGRVEIFDDYSTVDLPEGMPKELYKHLRGVWVCGQRLDISRLTRKEKPAPRADGDKKPKTKKSSKPKKSTKPGAGKSNL
ncbi:MAG: ATP-dependent RNA helicase DeaD [Halioglobus sp.]|jgi:ATP-dependent RNA helicase DeaD